MFTFRIAPKPGELVTQNNQREALIDVRDRTREDPLFRRRAAPRDEVPAAARSTRTRTSQVVTLQRTADNKYHAAADVDDPDELAPGFPKTRDELFAYRGLILGSIEAGAFTGDQLRMIGEFVERRGGGLLMLGGARSFCRRRLRRHAGRRRAAGRARAAGASRSTTLPVVAPQASSRRAPGEGARA